MAQLRVNLLSLCGWEPAMTSLDNRKLLIRFILIGLVITLYDVMLDALFSVLHIAFEWFELALEEIIEHVFHTTRQQSQISVFYLLWLILIYGLYRLARVLPCFFQRLKEQLLAAGLQYKAHITSYWRQQSLIKKIKLTISFALSLSCLTFFAFS